MMPITRLGGGLLLALTLLITSFYSSPSSRTQVTQLAASITSATQATLRYSQLAYGLPKDPTRAPGWIEGKRWVSADPEAQIHDWVQRMSEREDSPEMDWARNKTIVRYSPFTMISPF